MSDPVLPLEVTPQEVQQAVAQGNPMLLLDCREPHEYQLARLEGAELVPMRSVPAELQRLEAAAEESRIIVYCHHGVRSLHVADWLRQQGVENAQSLQGGIDRWSLEIDPSVPRYS